MATTSEIDDALECSDCNDALDRHLDRCRPTECGVVNAWAIYSTAPRASAMEAMMTAAGGTHESHDHRIMHDPQLDHDPSLEDDLGLSL